ncbi:MAG: TolC family protein [Desulfobacteraceae bacterium]|nr:MAG: TolC family protein [Desulfobacteraceae bacterium]
MVKIGYGSGLFIFLLFAHVAAAAESDLANRPLTLPDCIRIALEANPAGRAASAGVQGAKEAVGEAQAPFYPELGLQAGYHRFQSHAFLPGWVRIPPGSPTVVGPTDDWLGGLRARYTLYDFGERNAHTLIAKARQGLAEEEQSRIRQDIILSVYHGFYGLTSALEAKRVADQNLDRSRDHLRLTSLKKEAGAVPKADVLRAQVEVSNAQLALVRAENLIRLARGNLNLSLGRPAEAPVAVASASQTLIRPEQMDLYLSMEQAAQSRPEIKAALKKIEVSQGNIQAAWSAYGPRLRAEGSYGWRDSDFLPQDEDWAVGVTLEWPLFTGFARKHRLARAKADLSKEEAEAERLKLAVRQEVWNAFSRVTEMYQTLETTQTLVQDALESHRLSRERYEAGAGTITELLDAQTALARAQATRVEAEWDYRISLAQFKRAAGKLDTEN